jgi:hypothetical protein
MRHNHLIGGWYCERCDKRITTRDPKLEDWYNRRIASLARRKRPREIVE